MKLSQLVGERFKEKPADCVIDSHALMIRGGYIKQVSNGIYSQLTPLRRISRKIEAIIREEMEAIGGQEVLFPVVLPGSLWEESGRMESVGDELVRLTDRNGATMVLGMTHEEAAVHLAREYGASHSRYPFMIYQLQTKFRDERRPRAGLIRVREFTMKDGYSFHTSQADLEAYYHRCMEAYHRIFRRAGLKNVVAVTADSGMMGGSVSHEFMLLSPAGEDSLAICGSCDYKSNLETAACVVQPAPGSGEALEAVHTPGQQSMEAVCRFMDVSLEQSCKAVVYQRNADDSVVIVFTRGDLEVSEAKLTRAVGDVHAAEITGDSGLCAGFIGPHGLADDHTVLFDRSLEGASGLICGANREDYHYRGLSMERDIGSAVFYDLSKAAEGGICPVCGRASLTIQRGIEVGNIFQLGTKYTAAMGMQYQDSAGKLHHPIMGCYGIGVGRLAASVCEEAHDAKGPVWPLSIAPWQVHICALRAGEAGVGQLAGRLYDELGRRGIEAVLDDRDVSPGFMFSDADLLGVPVRVIFSPRNLAEGVCEIKLRDGSLEQRIPAEEAAQAVTALLERLGKA